MNILDALHYVWTAFTLTLTVLLTLFLPIIVICMLMNLIANEQNKRLYQIAGWPGLMMTAWIGTPIHELSHALVAFLTGQKIVEMKLFAPNERTGTLGYVVHASRNDNFFQAVIGNSLVPIAPFFGGAAAIYAIMLLFLPNFSLYAVNVPVVHYITSDAVFQLDSYRLFAESIVQFYQHLIQTVNSAHLWGDWKFYVGIFFLFGIASHLAPSYGDFRNFWQPVAVFILFLTLLNLFVLPFIQNNMDAIRALAQRIFLVMPILLLAFLISVIGLIVIYILYIMTIPFRR